MSFSLESALRTCKIDTGYATRQQSARFLNPAEMLCPLWNGLDTAGRPVCANSFITTKAGCSSALDRTQVENDLRPKYFSYVGLEACGLVGTGLSAPEASQYCPTDTKCSADLNMSQNKVMSANNPNFGLQLGAAVNHTNCGADGCYGPTQQNMVHSKEHMAHNGNMGNNGNMGHSKEHMAHNMAHNMGYSKEHMAHNAQAKRAMQGVNNNVNMYNNRSCSGAY
jgi:hypothetical protein